MILPPYLQEGDTVAIVATARAITVAELQAMRTTLQDWGLRVLLGDSIGLVHCQFAGTDEARAADFQQMLDNTDVKAVFCARGGYGTVRIIDKLDFSIFQKHPKWIVGFSDITVLHSHLHTQIGAASLHALMPSTYTTSLPQARQSLRAALFGKSLTYAMTPHPFNRIGTAKGQIIGGNLSLLYGLIGSPSDVDTTDKLLFIEDLDEYLYHIDRMMMNLKRSGKLEHLAALLVGGFSDMNDNTIPFGQTAYEIIAEHTADYSYPIAFNVPAGHIPDNRSLIFGQMAELTVTAEGSNLLIGDIA